MDFQYSPKVKDLQTRLITFMDEHVYPNEKTFFGLALNEINFVYE